MMMMMMMMPLLLMPWFLALPGHQQPCYWQCKKGRSLLSLIFTISDLENNGKSIYLYLASKINSGPQGLTHWGRVTHICVGKLTIIGSDNGLSPERRQTIIWTNAGILLIGPLGTNFSEILIVIQTFSLKKIRLKLSSAKCCSFRLGLNELIPCQEVVQVVCYQGTPMTSWCWGLGPLSLQGLLRLCTTTVIN